MKLSQPKSARIINRCRVLCLLRARQNLSKAELARILDLNKVSTGEIIENLIKDGFVSVSGKIEVSNGRKPTALQIVKDAGYVICVTIGSKIINVALCNLLGQTVKLERIMCKTDCSVEEFCAMLIRSCLRSSKLVPSDKLLGVCITVAGNISVDEKTIISCRYLPWTNIALADVFEQAIGVETVLINSAEALVSAEKFANARALTNSKPTIYLDWGDHISMCIINQGNIVLSNPDFGSFEVGKNKTLEGLCASWAIPSYSDDKLKNLWDDIPEEALEAMAKVLNITGEICGADRVIFGGDSCTIDKSALTRIQRECKSLLIETSVLGDKAYVVAASEAALDRFFYMSSTLDEMRQWI